MTQATGTNGAANYYVYDGDGRRVRRIVNGVETWQVYGIDGELLAEYAPATTSPQKEYGYRNGQLLITAEAQNGATPPQVKWLVPDHLGTPRIIVDASGSLSSVRRHDYLPFGEELTNIVAGGGLRSSGNGYVADTLRQKFTGQQRDAETGLDFYQSRYFSAAQGRFTIADTFSGRKTNPQTLNLYSYVINNPLKYNDPLGHFKQDPKKYDPKKDDTPIGVDDQGRPLYDCDCTDKVDAEPANSPPSLGVSIIPLVGNTLEANYNFRAGHPWKGALYTGLAVTDVFLIKSAAIGILKIGGNVFAKKAAEEIVAEALVESDVVLYHGTDILSYKSFLAGEGLDATRAAALKLEVGSPPGFFLATEAADAEFFAVRRGSGAVLEFRFSPSAVESLGGLPMKPLGPLGRFGSFLGSETVIPVRDFGKFNTLRESGAITIIPHK